MGDKSTYYKTWTDGDGIERVQEIILPSDADWAAKYAKRGFSTVPPQDFAPEEPEPDDGLDDLTVAELKDLAADEAIPVEGRKADIIEAIRGARAREEAAAATRN